MPELKPVIDEQSSPFLSELQTVMLEQVDDKKMLNQGFEKYAHEPGLPFKIYFVFRSILEKQGYDVLEINQTYQRCLSQARQNLMRIL